MKCSGDGARAGGATVPASGEARFYLWHLLLPLPLLAAVTGLSRLTGIDDRLSELKRADDAAAARAFSPWCA